MEDYKNKYEDLLDMIKDLYPNMTEYQQEKLQGVCPELAESKDEKIRKELIGHLTECRNNTRSEVMIGEYAKWIAWIEKQKPTEKVNAEDCGIEGIDTAIDILERTLGKIEGYQSDDGILEHKAAIVAVKKMKEQKPTREYSSLEITSVVRKALQECEDFRNYRPDVYAARVGSTVERLLNEQKPVEKWDDEDEDTCSKIIETIIHVKDNRNGKPRAHYADSLLDEFVGWLKSIKNRCVPQKQEWSEEDKETIKEG